MAGYIGSKASVVSSGAERKKTFAITTNTTSLTGLSYTVNQVHVFHNGVRLVDGTDYTATNGTSITLTSAAENGDEVVVISYASFQTSDTVSASAGGTFSNAVTIDADGATALTVDRATSDGTIIDVQKGGTSVGSIGTYNDYMTVGSGDTGLLIYNGGDVIRPHNMSSNSARDNAIDLGSSSDRFKDIYLSGGAYLGGTGGANKLDDYEEGTWTPAFLNVSLPTYTVQTGNYTKIGRLVHVTISIEYSGLNTGDASSLAINLPFAASASGVFHIAESGSSTGFAGSNTISLIGSTGAGSTSVAFGSTGDYNDGDYDSGNWNQAGRLRFAGSYPAS